CQRTNSKGQGSKGQFVGGCKNLKTWQLDWMCKGLFIRRDCYVVQQYSLIMKNVGKIGIK
ncbi:unnamed protein product, partial [Heterotrigona itama]